MEFEGLRQDEVDQLEVLLKAEVCEESDDEEYEEIDTNQRSSKKLKREPFLNHFELHKPVFVHIVLYLCLFVCFILSSKPNMF